ncbi:MAG: hypothetical protein ABI579_01450, partial [Candidatus Sumerlaeota bacterium]
RIVVPNGAAAPSGSSVHINAICHQAGAVEPAGAPRAVNIPTNVMKKSGAQHHNRLAKRDFEAASIRVSGLVAQSLAAGVEAFLPLFLALLLCALPLHFAFLLANLLRLQRFSVSPPALYNFVIIYGHQIVSTRGLELAGVLYYDRAGMAMVYWTRRAESMVRFLAP